MVAASDIRINVSADLLRRAALAKSNEKSRYYLGGVYVEPAKAGGVILTATDGHLLACLHDKEGYASHPVILNPDKPMLAWAKRADEKRRKEVGDKRVILRNEELVGSCALCLGEDFAVDPRLIEAHQWRDTWIDGKFPDYSRVIPKNTSVTPLLTGVNAVLVERALAVLWSSSNQCITLRAERDDGGVPMVALCDNQHNVPGYCIIMPMRGGLTEFPEFWKAQVATEEVAQ